jgi:hypothetical protein
MTYQSYHQMIELLDSYSNCMVSLRNTTKYTVQHSTVHHSTGIVLGFGQKVVADTVQYSKNLL